MSMMLTGRDVKDLARKALRARALAHAPYSRYRVGAAVRTAGRRPKIFTGCNVENRSYGATICAERVALCKAVSEGKKKFAAIAIATGGKEPAPPCGVCLQFMTEFGSDLIVILVAAKSKKMEITSLRELLPVQFAW